MSHSGSVSGSVAPAARRPLREAGIYYALAMGQCLALALALPHAGITPLLAIPTPLIAVLVVLVLFTPPGRRRAVWAGIGWRPPPWWAVLLALVLPATITVLSFAGAAAVGVARFPDLDLSLGGVAEAGGRLAGMVLVFGLAFLGEEIGWRGYLLPRLAEVTSGRRAAVVTGACHAAFHLPLLVIATTYQNAGNRFIVVPVVMVTLTLAGVVYGWLRLATGSIWPISLSHSAFNIFMQQAAAVAVVTSPAALAYTATETGLFTVGLLAALAGWLLVFRAADFDTARPPWCPPSATEGRHAPPTFGAPPPRRERARHRGALE